MRYAGEWLYAKTATHLQPGITDSRCAAREQQAGLLPNHRRPTEIPWTASTILDKIWGPGTRIRFDDQSCASAGHFEQRNRRLANDAVPRSLLRVVIQPYSSKNRHLVGRTFSFSSNRFRAVFICLLPLHRAEPGQGGLGRETSRLSVVQLSCKRVRGKKPSCSAQAGVDGNGIVTWPSTTPVSRSVRRSAGRTSIERTEN